MSASAGEATLVENQSRWILDTLASKKAQLYFMQCENAILHLFFTLDMWVEVDFSSE